MYYIISKILNFGLFDDISENLFFYPSNLILFIIIVSSIKLYYYFIELWVQESNNHYFIFFVYHFLSYFIHIVRIHSPLPIRSQIVLDLVCVRFFLSQPHLIAIFITTLTIPISLYILNFIPLLSDNNRGNPKRFIFFFPKWMAII